MRVGTLVAMLSLVSSVALAQDPSTPTPSPSPSPSPSTSTFALTLCVVTGEEGSPVPGATVILVAPDGSAAAVIAGDDGCARVPTLPPLTYKVTVTAPGAKPSDLTITVPEGGGALRNVRLEIATAAESEIIIEARREQPGETRRVIEPQIASKLPGSQGDALKAVQNLPGLARAPFGGAALIVRGAAPEDTRVFVDGQEIPQLYHFGGLTSVVATEMLQSIDFLPGGFGVRYGRALSGVVDVETRGARSDRWGGVVDADIYDASAFVEGPAGDSRVLAATRRSYIDFVLPAIVPDDVLAFTVAPRYYDYQLRYDAKTFANGLKTNVLAYGSDDALTFIIKEPPEDASVDLRGTFLFRTLFHQVQAGIAKPFGAGWVVTATPAVKYQTIVVELSDLAGFELSLTSYAARVEGRGRMQGYDNVRLLIGSEAEWTLAKYAINVNLNNEGIALNDAAEYGVGAAAVYIQAEIEKAGWTFVPGMRFDGYAPTGALSFDPRFSTRWERDDERVFAKGYLGLYHQPPDPGQWDADVGDPGLRVPYAIQTGLGGGVLLGAGKTTRVEAELFYKWIEDLVVDRPGTPGDPTDIGGPTNDRIGRAYGAEVLIRRELSEKLYGWIAYTLSKSERSDPYNPGGWRDFDYDQTHILTAVAGYKLRRGWELGVRLRYATGNPETFVRGALYDADSDSYVPIPGERNADRLPPFHQFDVRLDKTWEFRSWKLGVYLDVQNVYARQNPEGVRYDFDYEHRYLISGLPVLPAIGFRVEM